MGSKMHMPGWVGRRERDALNLPGSVLLRTGRSIGVTVVGMSGGGCRVECKEPIPIGATVRLDLGVAFAEAEVRWALSGAAGLQFLSS